MSEPIPPLWFSLIETKSILLYDETNLLGRVLGLNFVGDHVQASPMVSPDTGLLRGVVVLKNEGPIGDDAPLPAYFTSHGDFTIPTNSGTVSYPGLIHTQDSAHNITLVSGTLVTAMHTGLYYFESLVWGNTTQDICAEALPRSAPANFESKFYRYEHSVQQRNAAGTLQFSFGDVDTMAVENCHFGGTLVSYMRGLTRMTPGHTLYLGVVLSEFGTASPPPFHMPSAEGEFTFSMQKVSLGT